MKKLLSVLVLAALFFVGCSDNKTTATSQKEVIRVGTSGGYFPFTYVENDVLQGFEIDVWNAIGKKLDADIEFKTSKFSGLFGMLETGKIDTISNQITMTDKRVAKYYFASPYVYDGAQIVVHQDNNTIHSVKDLQGKKVGVTLGTNYEEILKKLNLGIDVISYEGGGFEQDVVLKRLDAYVQDRISAVELIKKSKLPLKLTGAPIEVLTNSFPFVKNEKSEALLKRVNTALESLRAEGVLSDLSIKWFNTDITKK